MNPSTDPGAIPANVSLNSRPMVTDGLADDVDDVAQYAASIHPATAAGASAPRPTGQREDHQDQDRRGDYLADPQVRGRAGCLRRRDSGRANIRLASTAPPTAPAVCAAM